MLLFLRQTYEFSPRPRQSNLLAWSQIRYCPKVLLGTVIMPPWDVPSIFNTNARRRESRGLVKECLGSAVLQKDVPYTWSWHPDNISTDPRTRRRMVLGLALTNDMMLSPQATLKMPLAESKPNWRNNRTVGFWARSRSRGFQYQTCAGISRSQIRLATCTELLPCSTASTGSGGSVIPRQVVNTSFKVRSNRCSFRQPLELALCQCIRSDGVVLEIKPQNLQTEKCIHRRLVLLVVPSILALNTCRNR